MKTFKQLVSEAKKLFVFASWENGVLKWRTDKADDRTGSDPFKKKPSEADVKKHLEKVLGTKVDLDFRVDESVDMLTEGSGAMIHTNPDLEKKLKKAGFDIPKFPKQGPVTLNDKEIGRMDNFLGLIIRSKSALALIKKTIPKIGIWNEGDAVQESIELFEALEWLAVWQGDHKSSIGWSDKPDDPNGGKAFVSGNIPHNAPFMFARKEVPRIIKLLKMKNSPIVKG